MPVVDQSSPVTDVQQAVPVAGEDQGAAVAIARRLMVQHFGPGQSSAIPADWVIDAMTTYAEFARLTEPTRLTPIEGVAASASMALMYLQTGFLECEACGAEIPTKHLDAAVELATVVQPYTPPATSPAIPEGKSGDGVGLEEISEDDLREAIRKSIDHPGMTQNLFARSHGISRGHLSEFLSGKRRAEPAIAGPCGYRWALVLDTRSTDDLTDAALTPDHLADAGKPIDATQTREADALGTWIGRALASFDADPPDSDHQRGYLSAVQDMRFVYDGAVPAGGAK